MHKSCNLRQLEARRQRRMVRNRMVFCWPIVSGVVLLPDTLGRFRCHRRGRTLVCPFDFGFHALSSAWHWFAAPGRQNPASASCCPARTACRRSRTAFLSAPPRFHGLHRPNAEALHALMRRWVGLGFMGAGNEESGSSNLFRNCLARSRVSTVCGSCASNGK